MQDLKELYEETGVGLADVKRALEEAEGDREKVLQIVRVKGLRSLSERKGCSARMGLIVVKITDTAAGQHDILVEVDAEAGSVVKTEKFIDIAEVVLQMAIEFGAGTIGELMKAKTVDGTVRDTIDVAAVITDEKLNVANMRQVEGEAVNMYLHKSSQDLPPTVGVLVAIDKVGAEIAHDVMVHTAVYSPECLNRDEAPVEAIEKKRETLTEATIAEGRPGAAITKTVEGKVNGFFKKSVLLDQFYAKDSKTTVGRVVEALKGKATGFARLRIGG